MQANTRLGLTRCVADLQPMLIVCRVRTMDIYCCYLTVTSGDFSDQRFLEEMLRESVFFANYPEVLPHVLLCTLKHVFRLYAVSPC